MGVILINLLTILIIVAVLYLILYLFQKYVMPIDGKIIGVVIFIVCALLIGYWITGHSLAFWK